MRTASLAYIVETLIFLFRVGLCPHGNLPLQDAWLHECRRKSTQGCRSRGPESTRSSSRHVGQKGFLSEALDGATHAGSRRHQSSSDDQRDQRDRDFGTQRGRHVALLETSIPHRTITIRRDFGSL